jgi:hypothetical protein
MTKVKIFFHSSCAPNARSSTAARSACARSICALSVCARCTCARAPCATCARDLRQRECTRYARARDRACWPGRPAQHP